MEHAVDTNWKNRRVTVMGLGHFGGGVGAARWLALQGASVTVTDSAPESSLADSLARLANVPIATFRLGEHRPEDFQNADLVVVNPAVRPGNHFIEIARQSGARVATEIELFLERCPAPVVGVTGSNGKSTTAAMTAAILRAAGFRTWLGGNLGGSLLESLDQIMPEDRVVLELSSFQLWHLRDGFPMPQVAVVTNCTLNHLNWHPDFAHYAAAKQRLLMGQPPDSAAVLNMADPEVATWARFVQGQRLDPFDDAKIPPLQVPGTHNRQNAAMAAAAAVAIGVSEEAVAQGLAQYTALPQRLELVAEIGSRRFYNDSSATTPESVLAALQALPPPIWLLAGGSDKGVDVRPLVSAVCRQAAGAAFYGQVGPRLREEAAVQCPGFCCTAVETLAEALDWCCRFAPANASIVLSPGFASLDQFRNFWNRGEVFAALVQERAHPV